MNWATQDIKFKKRVAEKPKRKRKQKETDVTKDGALNSQEVSTKSEVSNIALFKNIYVRRFNFRFFNYYTYNL